MMVCENTIIKIEIAKIISFSEENTTLIIVFSHIIICTPTIKAIIRLRVHCECATIDYSFSKEHIYSE